jgi:two-component system, chemotaxis family, chemotaxis protein CheY
MAKVLVVDDSESQRFELKKDLEGAGHQVIEGVNGADGIEKLQSNGDIALVISDVNMPVMDGITMCSKIHEAGKNAGLPIFMLTSEASAEQKEMAKKFGVRAWIIKPFVKEKLLSAVEKVTQKK